MSALFIYNDDQSTKYKRLDTIGHDAVVQLLLPNGSTYSVANGPYTFVRNGNGGMEEDTLGPQIALYHLGTRRIEFHMGSTLAYEITVIRPMSLAALHVDPRTWPPAPRRARGKVLLEDEEN